MTKELDALQEVRQQLIYYKEYAKEKLPTKAEQINAACEEELNLIEAALKEYELMKDIRITARFDLAQVNKEHKALEIIKDKKVCVMWLRNSLSSYNSTAALYDLPILTQEEFDLLKEVLL